MGAEKQCCVTVPCPSAEGQGNRSHPASPSTLRVGTPALAGLAIGLQNRWAMVSLGRVLMRKAPSAPPASALHVDLGSHSMPGPLCPPGPPLPPASLPLSSLPSGLRSGSKQCVAPGAVGYVFLVSLHVDAWEDYSSRPPNGWVGTCNRL